MRLTDCILSLLDSRSIRNLESCLEKVKIHITFLSSLLENRLRRKSPIVDSETHNSGPVKTHLYHHYVLSISHSQETTHFNQYRFMSAYYQSKRPSPSTNLFQINPAKPMYRLLNYKFPSMAYNSPLAIDRSIPFKHRKLCVYCAIGESVLCNDAGGRTTRRRVLKRSTESPKKVTSAHVPFSSCCNEMRDKEIHFVYLGVR